jgi:hypothetical protein
LHTPMNSVAIHLSVLCSRRIFDPLKGPTYFRRDEFKREAIFEFRLKEASVHCLPVVVFLAVLVSV